MCPDRSCPVSDVLLRCLQGKQAGREKGFCESNVMCCCHCASCRGRLPEQESVHSCLHLLKVVGLECWRYLVASIAKPEGKHEYISFRKVDSHVRTVRKLNQRCTDEEKRQRHRKKDWYLLQSPEIPKFTPKRLKNMFYIPSQGLSTLVQNVSTKATLSCLDINSGIPKEGTSQAERH